jgi:hypothetical protein
MSKHFSELSQQELNNFLIEKYDFGLQVFALILYHKLRRGDITRAESFPNKRVVLDVKNRLQNLRKRIIDVILDYEMYILENPDRKMLYKIDNASAENMIVSEYNLKKFFDLIDNEIELFDQALESRLGGAPIKKRNLIASLWACLIQNKSNKIDWELIANLLDWFWERLKFYDIYKKLNPKGKVDTDVEYLRNQFYRNKKRAYDNFKELKLEYFNNDISNIESIIFFGKKSYMKMEYSFLLELEGSYRATLRSQKHKTFCEDILSGKITKINLFGIFMAYNFYAEKVYFENPKALPLIIFPDLSYL